MELIQAVRPSSSRGLVRTKVIVANSGADSAARLSSAIMSWGHEAIVVCDYSSLAHQIAENESAIVILDENFVSTGDLAALGYVWLDGFSPRVILIASKPTREFSERAARMGSITTLQRSADLNPLKNAISTVIGGNSGRPSSRSPLLGNSAAIREMRETIRNVADSDAAVMILGESGTGKELIAHAIHDCSPRAAGEYVPVNMAALPENLVESVLFGYEKGAFTGADQRQEGMCQHADGGTLFLDEIGEMNRELQPKLLRFLQNQTVQRVGASSARSVDVRIVSATNRNVHELVHEGVLRKDLFYRLHVIPIIAPPLRERREDIPLLATAFLERRCGRMRKQMTFSEEALERLCEYSWPGNIRQLENLVERLAVTSKCDVIDAKCLPLELFSVMTESSALHSIEDHFITDLDQHVCVNDRQLTRMESAERRIIIEALHRHDGNVCAVARFLGIGPATIYRKIRTLEITKSEVR